MRAFAENSKGRLMDSQLQVRLNEEDRLHGRCFRTEATDRVRWACYGWLKPPSLHNPGVPPRLRGFRVIKPHISRCAAGG